MVFRRESGHRACFVVEVPLFSQDKDQVVGLAIYHLGPSKGNHFSESLNDDEQAKLTRLSKQWLLDGILTEIMMGAIGFFIIIS
jgi:hypothetical protein